MRIRQHKVITLVAVLVFVLAANCFAQRKGKHQLRASDTKFGLQLSIDLDDETFPLDSSLTLKAVLKNVGQVPITLLKRMGWGRSSSFSMSILDEKGNLVIGRMLDDAIDVRSVPFQKEDFITIQPGESIRRERLVDFPSKGIGSPGIYQIIVNYHSSVSRRSAPEGLKIWAMENGVLQSKPARFTVTQ